MAEDHQEQSPANPESDQAQEKVGFFRSVALRLKELFLLLVDRLLKGLKAFFSSRAWKIMLLVFEVVVVFIMITRGAQVVLKTYDGFFTRVFAGVFELIDTAGDTTAVEETADAFGGVTSLFMVSTIRSAFYSFYGELLKQGHPLLKVIMIIKAILLVVLMGALIYRIFIQSFGVRNSFRSLLLMFKLFLSSLFLLGGTTSILMSFSGSIAYDQSLLAYIFSFGDMFDIQVLKEAFLGNKLIVILLFYLLARDNVFYYLDYKLPALVPQKPSKS